MKRREFLKLGAAGLLQPFISGCPTEIYPAIRIAAHSWLGYEFFFAARELGYLQPSLVDITETHSASVSMRLLSAGAVEAACLTMDEVLTCLARGLDLVVIAILDFSYGADVVMAKEEVLNQQDVIGKTLGVESTATGAVMLNAFLESMNIAPHDVDIKYLTIDEHFDAYKTNQVDLLVTYEPVRSHLESEGMKTIYTSRSNPRKIFDVVAVRRAEVENGNVQLKHLLSGHFRSVDMLQRKPDDILPILSNRMKLTHDAVKKAYTGIELPNLDENIRLLSGDSPVIIDSITSLAETMVEASLISSLPDLSRVIDSRFLA